jgi:hypothetical protein
MHHGNNVTIFGYGYQICYAKKSDVARVDPYVLVPPIRMDQLRACEHDTLKKVGDTLNT